MSKRLDIDTNNQIWIPAFLSAIRGEQPVCPRCGSSDVEVNSMKDDNGVGFIVITCNTCSKTGYLSRIKFPEKTNKMN